MVGCNERLGKRRLPERGFAVISDWVIPAFISKKFPCHYRKRSYTVSGGEKWTSRNTLIRLSTSPLNFLIMEATQDGGARSAWILSRPVMKMT
jgi:hypothetical protein